MKYHNITTNGLVSTVGDTDMLQCGPQPRTSVLVTFD